jgi:hypothetical protein
VRLGVIEDHALGRCPPWGFPRAKRTWRVFAVKDVSEKSWNRASSILAEVEFLQFATEGIFDEFLSAIGAKIEPQRFVNFAANRLIGMVIHALQCVLKFKQVILIVIDRSLILIQCGKNLDLDHIAQVILRVQWAFAAIATVMKHGSTPRNEKTRIRFPVRRKIKQLRRFAVAIFSLR